MGIAGNGTAHWLGSSEHTLDEKWRVFIPRRFQAGFGFDAEGRTQVYLTRGFERCLALYSEAGFDGLLRRLETEAFAGAEARRMQRLFFSNAHRTLLDGSGRLLLPENLRAQAGIERDVVLIGLVDRVEIWSKPVWKAFESGSAADFDSLDRVLSGPERAATQGSVVPGH
jgi:MraZ protein